MPYVQTYFTASATPTALTTQTADLQRVSEGGLTPLYAATPAAKTPAVVPLISSSERMLGSRLTLSDATEHEPSASVQTLPISTTVLEPLPPPVTQLPPAGLSSVPIKSSDALVAATTGRPLAMPQVSAAGSVQRQTAVSSAERGVHETYRDFQLPHIAIQREATASFAAPPVFEVPTAVAPTGSTERSELAVQRAPLDGESAAAAVPAHASEKDLDDLARKLHERISSRIRFELLLDRERAGMVTDLR
jgi:hypothetical protein